MKLKYRINLVSLAILVGVAVAITTAGLLAINDVTYDLNRQLMSKEVVNLLARLQSTQEILQENGLAGVDSYVQSAQNEIIGEFRNHKYGQSGQLLIAALSGNTHSKYHLRVGQAADAACMEQMIGLKSGTLQCPSGGKERFFSFAFFPQWDWLVALSVSSEEMLDARTRFLQQVFIIVTVTLVFGIMIFLWFTDSLVRPIQQLVKATERVSEGKWDEPLPVAKGAGELAQLSNAFRDMSARLAEMYNSLQQNLEEIKQSQEALRVSEEKYRDLVELLPQIIFETDCNGDLIFVNRTAFEDFGYSLDDLGSGLSLYNLFTPSERARAEENISRILRGEKLGMMEYEAVRKDGSEFPVIAIMLPIISEDKAVGLRGILVNITERKALENGLLRAQEFLQNILNNVPDPIFVKNDQHQWLLVNDALCQFVGHKREDLLGKSDYDFFSVEEADVFWKKDDLVFETSIPHENEEKITDVTGRQHAILTKKAVFRDADGKKVLIGSIKDITERKKMEDEMLRSQKLESIGLLAGGIAHDFNNILATILGNLSLGKTYVKPSEPIYESLEESEKACLRARDLTQQLLTFSRGGAPIKRAAAIGDLLQDWGKFALRGSNVTGEFFIPGDLWPVEIDEGQMTQVVNNLVFNAVQAMPQGGVIKFYAENVTLGESTLLPLQAGRYVKLSVEDHGVGIPQKILPKVFDPYFTTKETGSGLGLATAHSIIRRHNGYITVESQANVGTVFHIYIPATTLKIPEKTEERTLPIAGKGRILIMDDDVLLRNLVGAMLRRLGYEVAFAGDGAEAIEIYQNSAHSFDAVIMDLTIPGGMGGKEAINILKQIDPEVKAIVSSGYSIDPVMANYKRYGFLGMVSKPYELAELSRVVNEVLSMDA